MSTTTTNLSLVKPTTAELADITVINSNMDLIDTAVTARALASRTVNGHALTGNVSVTATDVSLGNCDNTSDANKPISTATQNALNTKAYSFGVVKTAHCFPVTAAVTVGSSNRTCYYRVRDGGTITAIRVQIINASGNICVAAYTNTGSGLTSAPGARLGTSGSISCPSAAVNDISLGGSIVVAPGDWLAIAADNTSATFSGLAGIGDLGLSAGIMGISGDFPCPSPGGTFSPGNNRMIALVGV